METLFLPILLFAVFYFAFIRPQQKQRREIAQVQSTVEPGARVMTSSGLIATVVSVDADEVVLEVAPGVTNRYVRKAIMRVVPDETAEPERIEEPTTQPVADEPTTRPLTDGTSANRDDAPGTSP